MSHRPLFDTKNKKGHWSIIYIFGSFFSGLLSWFCPCLFSSPPWPWPTLTWPSSWRQIWYTKQPTGVTLFKMEIIRLVLNLNNLKLQFVTVLWQGLCWFLSRKCWLLISTLILTTSILTRFPCIPLHFQEAFQITAHDAITKANCIAITFNTAQGKNWNYFYDAHAMEILRPGTELNGFSISNPANTFTTTCYFNNRELSVQQSLYSIYTTIFVIVLLIVSSFLCACLLTNVCLLLTASSAVEGWHIFLFQRC